MVRRMSGCSTTASMQVFQTWDRSSILRTRTKVKPSLRRRFCFGVRTVRENWTPIAKLWVRRSKSRAEASFEHDCRAQALGLFSAPAPKLWKPPPRWFLWFWWRKSERFLRMQKEFEDKEHAQEFTPSMRRRRNLQGKLFSAPDWLLLNSRAYIATIILKGAKQCPIFYLFQT